MDEPAIIVSEVSKTFKLPHEKHNSLKSMFINIFRSKRTYERQKVLKNVSFKVQKGDFFAIVGRNGSGKSTLLKLLAGIYSPDNGAVVVNGKLTPFIELGVGFNPELTGRQNVYLNGALLGFSTKEMAAMYDDIVEFAELHDFMDQKLRNYSSGMQVRLAFSIAIRARTDILLLDEVLAVGDAAFQQKCYNYFEQLKREKKTVVFVSHDMSAVRRFCTKALYVKDGKIIHEGSPTEVADIYTTENLEDSNPESTEQAGEELSSLHGISSTSREAKNGSVILDILYQAKDAEEMYIGISVQKDGYSLAEINTSESFTLVGSGKVSYTLDRSMFNPGAYYVGMGLFLLKNRQLVAVAPVRNKFTVKGNDMARGGAIKLSDTWKIKK